MRVFSRLAFVVLAVAVLSAPTAVADQYQATCPLTLVATNAGPTAFYQSPHGVFRFGSQVFALRGQTLTTYTVTELEQGRRVVLDGVGEKATSRDTIVFEPAGGGDTRITYTADFRLKGLLRLVEPFLGRTFTTLAQRALAGLEAELGGASGNLGS